MNSSAIGRSTMIRRADMQICPWCRNAPNARRVDRVLEVGVGEDDQRVVAAELEHDALQLPAGRLGELAARAGRAGEVEPAHGRVLDQLVADRARLAGRVRDDVQDAGRQPGLGEDLAPEQAARRSATTRTASGRRCCRARAARRSSGPTGSAPRSTARSRRRRRPGGGAPSRTRRCRTGSPRRAARTRSAAAWRNRPGTKRIWNMPKPNVRRSRARAARRPRRAGSRARRPPSRKMRCRSAGGVCDHAGNAAAAASTARARVGARPAGDARDDLAGERVGVVERRAARGVDPLAADELLDLHPCRRGYSALVVVVKTAFHLLVYRT